jgi:hypothetical protein
VLFEAADDDGLLYEFPYESTAILAMDRVMSRRRLFDGRTLLERFVARRPPLADDEREMLLEAALPSARKPSTTANRCPLSPSSANASPSCFAAPDSRLGGTVR